MKDFATIRKIAGRQVVIFKEASEADGFRVCIKFVLKNETNVGMNMSFTTEKAMNSAFQRIRSGKSDDGIASQIKELEKQLKVESV